MAMSSNKSDDHITIQYYEGAQIPRNDVNQKLSSSIKR